jgi:hypothetical protein
VNWGIITKYAASGVILGAFFYEAFVTQHWDVFNLPALAALGALGINVGAQALAPFRQPKP